MQRVNRVIPALAVIAVIVLAACAARPAPLPKAPTSSQGAAVGSEGEAPATPTAVAPGEDWARIKAAGKLIVGSSLDYPPFSYRNDTFQPDGFDVALITEIGKRLGLKVEIVDFAFEGLIDAVVLKQIDVAIAAMTITPARAKDVDFTAAYYTGADAVLAAADAPISSFKTIDQLAEYRVGVQRGTIYESFLQNNLVDAGRMPQANLLSFVKPEDAVKAVQEKKIDLVVMDKLPAQVFVKQGVVKQVGESVNEQQFGIAARQGASELLTELNKTLTAIKADGTLDKLTQQYLAGAPVSWHASDAAAMRESGSSKLAAPAAQSNCRHGAAWVADLNLDDQGMTAPPVMQPGQAFTKGWRYQNSGNCDWKPSFMLVYVSGSSSLARMGGQAVPVGKTVRPGETIDLYANLVAPTAPGTYQGIWQMTNATGKPFGQRVWVGITVPGGAPVPTQTPAPGISFSVDRTTINAGECVVFQWNVQNVNGVYFYPDGANYQQFGVVGQASQTVCPSQTTTYDLRVDLRNGTTAMRQITINVNPSQNVPVITQFSSNPQNQAVAGQCIQFAWQVQGAVNRVALVRNGGVLWDYAPASGSTQDCPPAGGYNYELQAFGPGGMVKANIGMNVTQPMPTPVP